MIKKINFFIGNLQIPVKKCPRPSFKNINGRSWDHGYINLNGIKTEAWLDTTWGRYIYFVFQNSWYKVEMWSSGLADLQKKGYDIDPFSTVLSEIKTHPVNV